MEVETKKSKGIKVVSAILHQATLLPGGKTESSLNEIKLGKCEMAWFPGDGLSIKIGEKSAFIPSAALKIVHFA